MVKPQKFGNFDSDCKASGCVNERVTGDVYCIGHGGEFKQCERCSKPAIAKGLCDDHRVRKERRKCFKPNCTTIAWKGIYCFKHRDKSMCREYKCFEQSESWSDFCKAHAKGPKPRITICPVPKGGYVLREKTVAACKFDNCHVQKRSKGYCLRHATLLGFVCEYPKCHCVKVEFSQFCNNHNEVERRIIN